MNFLKISLVWLLAVSMLLSFAGCGKNKEPDPTEPQPTTQMQFPEENTQTAISAITPVCIWRTDLMRLSPMC